MSAIIAIEIIAGVVLAIVVFGPFIPDRKCRSNSIYSHSTYLEGSLHRVCADCGAEFDADYFEAREGGGNVMRYYRMTKKGIPK